MLEHYGNLKHALSQFNQPDDDAYQGIFEYFRNGSNSTHPGAGARYAYELWAAYHPDNKTEGNTTAASNALMLMRHYDLHSGVVYDVTQSKRVENLIFGNNALNLPSLDMLLGDFLEALSDLEKFSSGGCATDQKSFACVSNFYTASSFLYQAVAGSLAVKEIAQYTYRQMNGNGFETFDGRPGYPAVTVNVWNLTVIQASYRQLYELAHQMYSDKVNTGGNKMLGVLTATMCNHAGKDIPDHLDCGYFAAPDMRGDKQAAETNGGWRKNGGCTTWNITKVATGATLDKVHGSNVPMFGLVQAWFDQDEQEYSRYRFISDSGTTDVKSPALRAATVNIIDIDTNIRAELACNANDANDAQFSVNLGESVITQPSPTIYHFNLYSQYSANGYCASPTETGEAVCGTGATVHRLPACNGNATFCMYDMRDCKAPGPNWWRPNKWCSGKGFEVPPSV